MEELRPCPFCGRPAETGDEIKPFRSGWIGCRVCRCYINWTTTGKSYAVKTWNSRANVNTRTAEFLMEDITGDRQLCDAELPEYMHGMKFLKGRWKK